MTCATARRSTVSIGGVYWVFKTDSFQSLCLECGFHNVDRRVEQAFLANAVDVGEHVWRSVTRDTQPAVIDVAMENPEGYFGAQQLMAWEARSFHEAKPGIHRAVALGASVTNTPGGEPHFLTINRQNRGLKTIGFTPASVLRYAPDTYFLYSR